MRQEANRCQDEYIRGGVLGGLTVLICALWWCVVCVQ